MTLPSFWSSQHANTLALSPFLPFTCTILLDLVMLLHPDTHWYYPDILPRLMLWPPNQLQLFLHCSYTPILFFQNNSSSYVVLVLSVACRIMSRLFTLHVELRDLNLLSWIITISLNNHPVSCLNSLLIFPLSLCLWVSHLSCKAQPNWHLPCTPSQEWYFLLRSLYLGLLWN